MVVLPQSLAGMMSGIILALSRAIGETAPILVVSSLVFITYVPTTPVSRFTVLPLQIVTWVSQPQDEFRQIAAAAIIVLLVMLLSMNAAAIYIRGQVSTPHRVLICHVATARRRHGVGCRSESQPFNDLCVWYETEDARVRLDLRRPTAATQDDVRLLQQAMIYIDGQFIRQCDTRNAADHHSCDPYRLLRFRE